MSKKSREHELDHNKEMCSNIRIQIIFNFKKALYLVTKLLKNSRKLF